MNNRLWNVKNPAQGTTKKVLCVCSAGLLRSPTAAVVLSQEPFSFNTRSCGFIKDYALIYCDNVLIEWADEIVLLEPSFYTELRSLTDKPIINLDILDHYNYREKKLMELIKEKYLLVK